MTTIIFVHYITCCIFQWETEFLGAFTTDALRTGARARVPLLILYSRQSRGIWLASMREEVSGAKALFFPYENFDHSGRYLGCQIFRSI
jgi:hypothetical protein